MKQGQKIRSVPLSINVRKVDEENLRITHTVNTKTLDRYDTVVLPKGVNAEKFLKNSVVLWLHNSDETLPKIPIGRCVELDVREDEIVATTEFNRNDPLAVKVFQAYRDGFLHAWSIGFIPKGYKRVDEENMEDINKKYGLSITKEDLARASFWGLYLIYEWELLEYSAVPVPGNPDALSYDADKAEFTRELVTRGLVEEGEVRNINFRDLLKKKEKRAEGEGAEGQAAEVPAPAAEETPAETPAEEEAPAETPSEEAPAPAPAEAPAEEATPAPAEEATPAEVSPAAEAPAEAETPTESTEEAPAASEAPVTEAPASETDRTAQAQIAELTQRNAELSERLAQLENKLTEVEANLDVDNIDKIRAVAQKKLNSNPETFFSRLLKQK
jgi:outer membrane biosynthesis protein TonB